MVAVCGICSTTQDHTRPHKTTRAYDEAYQDGP